MNTVCLRFYHGVLVKMITIQSIVIASMKPMNVLPMKIFIIALVIQPLNFALIMDLDFNQQLTQKKHIVLIQELVKLYANIHLNF